MDHSDAWDGEGDRTVKLDQLCVALEVSIDALEASAEHGKNNIQVPITISFYCEEFDLPLGSIRIGLKEAQISMNIDGGSMPLGDRWPTETLKVSLDKIRVHTQTEQQESATTQSKTVGIASKIISQEASASLDHSSNKAVSLTNSTEDKFAYSDPQIQCGGAGNQPFWRFQNKADDNYLYGILKSQSLGKIVREGESLVIKIGLKSWSRSLWIQGAEGIWPSEMNKANLAVRKIVIWKWLKDLIGETQILELKIND